MPTTKQIVTRTGDVIYLTCCFNLILDVITAEAFQATL
jgi:hypothetical protein